MFKISHTEIFSMRTRLLNGNIFLCCLKFWFSTTPEKICYFGHLKDAIVFKGVLNIFENSTNWINSTL